MGQRQVEPVMSLTQVVPAQQSLPPGRQNPPRCWQRQVPMVDPMGRSHCIAPQHSSAFMHDCPSRRHTQLPPLQVLCPQQSEPRVQLTAVAVMVSAG